MAKGKAVVEEGGRKAGRDGTSSRVVGGPDGFSDGPATVHP